MNEFLLRFASKYASLILSFHLHYNLHYFIKQTRSIVQDKTNTHIHIYITRLFSKASLWLRSLLEQHKSRTVIKVTSVATFERGIIRNRRDGGARVGEELRSQSNATHIQLRGENPRHSWHWRASISVIRFGLDAISRFDSILRNGTIYAFRFDQLTRPLTMCLACRFDASRDTIVAMEVNVSRVRVKHCV